MTLSARPSDRLIRHDRLILVNATRAVFAGWYDRLVAVAALVAVVATLRASVRGLPLSSAVWLACAGGVVLGVGVARGVAARLSFLACDGVLAADALCPALRRRYAAVWHGVVLVALGAVVLIILPALVGVAWPGYLAGVIVAGLVGGARLPEWGRHFRFGWAMRTWLNRPSAGMIAALVLLLSLALARDLGAEALIAIAGIASLLLGLAITTIDDGVVRFMTLAGHRARTIALRHAGGIATFAVASVPIGWWLVGQMAAGIAAAVSLVLVVLLILRILCYRLHGRRIADMLVGTVVGVILLTAYAVPFALPVVAIAILWQLQRRARVKRWLLL